MKNCPGPGQGRISNGRSKAMQVKEYFPEQANPLVATTY